jgi:CTP:phosphocholine cytidylyltransferase-like protein
MNAIILAAGMGTRLRPLTDEIPKALVEVDGESFFGRQVRLLGLAGVDDITVVTGYRASAFEPWRADPRLRFVHNERYHDWNNLYSMHLVRDRLGDTLVLDGDVWIGAGVLPAASPATSRWYVGRREAMRNEWAVACDDIGRVERIDVRSGSGWILTGISYWTGADGAFLSGVIESLMGRADAPSLFWDDAPRTSLGEIYVTAERLGSADWAEVDTVEELEALRKIAVLR